MIERSAYLDCCQAAMSACDRTAQKALELIHGRPMNAPQLAETLGVEWTGAAAVLARLARNRLATESFTEAPGAYRPTLAGRRLIQFWLSLAEERPDGADADLHGQRAELSRIAQG